jgi:hypothetical protein
MSPIAQWLSRNAAIPNHHAGRLIALAAIAVWALSQQASTNAGPLRTVALTGRPVPGAPAGVTFDSFGNNYFVGSIDPIFRGPVLNDAGQAAFRADLAGSGIDSTNNQGVWSEGSGSLAVVARTGSQAPGAPTGTNFGTIPGRELFTPVLNNAGQTAFFGALAGGRLGVWSEGSGSLKMVVADGVHAPVLPNGVNFSYAIIDDTNRILWTDWPHLNDAGQVVFSAALTGTGVTGSTDLGVWLGKEINELTLVGRKGDQAAGLPAGVRFHAQLPIGLNDAGQMSLPSYLQGTGVNSSNNLALFTGGLGGLTLVVRNGDHLPGTSSNVMLENFFFPMAINSVGKIAFQGWLTGGDVVDGVDDEGLWSNVSGSLQLVARSGGPAADAPAGVNYGLFSKSSFALLNDSGQLAFHGALAGSGVDESNNEAIWLGAPDDLALVVRRGEQAPDIPSGTTFGHMHYPSLNNAGQIAFRAELTGDEVGPANNRGIWATDRDGNLQLIARTGDQMEVAPGDSRTLALLDFVTVSGNSDGRRSAFNNLGQLAFWASFSDGTQGVFISNEVANFAWKNLTKVHFFGADLTGADLTGADARGISGLNLSGVTAANLIHPDGHIAGLNLATGQKLVAYAGVPIPVKVTGEFSIATGATFDITDNAAIVDYSGTSPVATVRDKVLSGRGGAGLGASWTGTGITSSAAATANTTEPESRSVGYAENSTMPLGPYTEFHGTPVDGTSILMAFTRTGDANLDGVVNDDDVTIIGATYAPGVPQPSWALGDFDYNGFVDDDDVTLLGALYDPVAAPLVSPPAEPGASVAAVPEPETAALLVTGLVSALFLAGLARLGRRKIRLNMPAAVG